MSSAYSQPSVMWIQYALFSSFLWAIVHILDEYCVDKIFSKPWLGVITSSGISVGIFLIIPLMKIGVVIPAGNILFICLITGAIIQFSQFFYFRALDNSDSGTVAAYWNITPVLLPIASYWLFGYLITGNNYLGIALLVIASIGLCTIDKFSSRWDTLSLMSIAAGLQTVAIVLEKYIFGQADFFGAFLAINIGIILSGLASLGIKEVRSVLVRDLPQIKQALPIFIAIELLNWVALYTGQIAVKLGDPALVSAIGASTPAYAFGLSLLIAIFGQRLDLETRRKLPMKWGLVGVMMVGVWLIGASARG
ncbi:EamA family transporter [Chamaesiphon sp.]|uniref:EamA family transporter n=1 Tax=Chamaesiphon sp. TaxID=2814140 RepID=UPI00359492B8